MSNRVNKIELELTNRLSGTIEIDGDNRYYDVYQDGWEISHDGDTLMSPCDSGLRDYFDLPPFTGSITTEEELKEAQAAQKMKLVITRTRPRCSDDEYLEIVPEWDMYPDEDVRFEQYSLADEFVDAGHSGWDYEIDELLRDTFQPEHGKNGRLFVYLQD